jgi:hypothetical protein
MPLRPGFKPHPPQPFDPWNVSMFRGLRGCRVTHLTKNVINIEKTRTRGEQTFNCRSRMSELLFNNQDIYLTKTTCKANCASEKTIQRSTLFAEVHASLLISRKQICNRRSSISGQIMRIWVNLPGNNRSQPHLQLIKDRWRQNVLTL